MDYQKTIGFYAVQADALSPGAKSMGEIPRVQVKRSVRVAQSFHQPLGCVTYVPPAQPTELVVANNESSLPVAPSSWLNNLYNRPMDRKEFIVTSAGIGVMALGIKSILERKLTKNIQHPLAHQAVGFGAGPYGR